MPARLNQPGFDRRTAEIEEGKRKHKAACDAADERIELPRKKLLMRAATLLREDAECLRASHMLDGKWFFGGPEAKRAKKDYDERIAIAAGLVAMALLQ